jgi:paraquat-inducible protein A
VRIATPCSGARFWRWAKRPVAKTCAAVLFRGGRLTIDSWLALTIVAAIVFVMANAMPVMRTGLHGQHGEAMLWQFPLALAHGAAALIAVPAALSVIVVPCMQIVLLGWLPGFTRAGRRAPGFAWVIRVLAVLRPWSMLEVALPGIVVSIIKLSSYAQVAPGGAFWAMTVLMVLITLIISHDIHELWDMVEQESLLAGTRA